MSRYAEVLGALFASRRSGIDFGLGRVRKCLEVLALPSPAHVVQVAGTNGKGSTANYIAGALEANGVATGVFSSPHLLSICERFRISGKPVGRKDFVRAYNAVEYCIGELSFFEQITVLAAWLFADAGVSVAIYEVGLGGRLDSTTALPADIGLVTGIALDHCEFLGDSLEEVAAEKAGIFREDCPAIIGLSATKAIRELLATLAQKRGSHVRWVGDEHRRALPPLTLAGAHQEENASAAMAVVGELQRRGLLLDSQVCRAAIANAKFPGRLQEIADNLWVDGAHNSQAAEALAAAILDWESVILVVGISAGKDVEAFLRPLQACCHTLIVSEAQSDRALAASAIAEVASTLGFGQTLQEADLPLALERARELAGPRAILVTGSLFIVADALAMVSSEAKDPILLSDPAGVA